MTVIPALLVLSACQAGPKANDKIFVEDTLAHEELFGAVDFGGINKNIRKLDPVTHPDNDPTIGVQFSPEVNGKVNIRFVAAVTFTSENITPTVAKWTRTVSKPDGTAYAKDTGEFECKTAYTSLSTNGDPYTIQQFNQDHNNSTYTHFVVYTLRNVPVTSYGDYYVCAYLTLSQGVSQTSKALATTVNGASQFAFDAANGYYYLDGVIGGSNKVVAPTKLGDGNKAEFDDITFAEGDNFVIKGFINTKLTIHAADYLKGANNPIRYYFDCTNNSITSVFAGKYDLFVNNDSQLWSNVDSVSDTNRYLYCYIENSFNYFGDGGYPILWVFDSTHNHDSYWLTFEGDLSANTWLKTSAKIDTSKYDSVDLVRMHNATPNWNNKSTQSPDMVIGSINDASDCIYSKGDWDHQTYEWGLRVVLD